MFKVGDPVRDKRGIAAPSSEVGIVLESRSDAEDFTYVVRIRGGRYLYRECEIEAAEVLSSQWIDREILSLVVTMNTIEGITTINSCCGHNGDRGGVRVWFKTASIKAMYPLARFIDPRYGGSVPVWTITVEDSDTAQEGQPGVCGVIFCLRSPNVGPEAYEQGEALAGRINRFWAYAEEGGYDFGVRKRCGLTQALDELAAEAERANKEAQ